MSGYVPVTASAHEGQRSLIPQSWNQIVMSQTTCVLSMELQFILLWVISLARVEVILSISTVFRKFSSRTEEPRS